MMKIDQRIENVLHPESNGLKLKNVAEGASYEHIVKADIKQLIRDVLDEVTPGRLPFRDDQNPVVYEIWNEAVDEMEAKAKELGL